MRFARAPEQPHGWDNPGRGYYAQLADGFLQGHAYLTIAPDPAMAALGDPYDYGQRDALQYQFTPPRIAAKFPHVEAGTAQIDKSLAWR